MSTTTSLFIFATLLLLQSKTPALSPSAATYYFIGAVLRQCHIGFDRISVLHRLPYFSGCYFGHGRMVRLGHARHRLLLLVLHFIPDVDTQPHQTPTG